MSNQKGNVLFIILVAVALFAALSYAVTQTTRGGGNSEKETSLVNSAALTQFGASVTSSVLRMMVNGIDETNLCFFTGSNHADYNHASCSESNNRVFNINGGKASYANPPNNINDGSDWEFTSRAQIYGQGSTNPAGGVGHNAETDLVMLLRGMNRAVCESINKESGITGIPVDAGDINVDRFDGDFTHIDSIDGCPADCTDIGSSPIGSIGTNIGCIEEGVTGDLIYFHTLLAR